MKYTTVIFDLDGTLANTLNDIARLMNRMLREHGWPEHSVDAYRRFVGDGVVKLAERAMPDGEKAHAEELVAEYMPVLEREGTQQTKLYDGIGDMLDALTERRIKRGVLSNKPDAATKQAVKDLLGRWTFDAVRGHVDGEKPKPDPAAARAMIQQLGVRAEQVLYVGDSDVDMKLANNAGFTAVGAGWGFRGEPELRASGAAHVIHEPTELLKLL